MGADPMYIGGFNPLRSALLLGWLPALFLASPRPALAGWQSAEREAHATESCCAADASPPAATVRIGAEGRTVLVREGDLRSSLTQVYGLERRIYEVRKAAVDEWLLQRLLELDSKFSGRPVAEIVDAEITRKSVPIPGDVQAFFEVRYPHWSWLQRFWHRRQAESMIRRDKAARLRSGLLQELSARYAVFISYGFGPPAPLDLDVRATPGEPFVGNLLSPLVEVDVFSEYRCPHCRDLSATLRRLAAEQGSGILIRFRDFPSNRNPVSVDAFLAARLAFRRGRFLEMQSLLFSHQRELTRSRILELASACGLRADELRRELEDEALRNQVLEGAEVGKALGIRSTPTVIVGSQAIVGARPYEIYTGAVAERLLLRLAARPRGR